VKAVQFLASQHVQTYVVGFGAEAGAATARGHAAADRGRRQRPVPAGLPGDSAQPAVQRRQPLRPRHRALHQAVLPGQ
jgi:hypothetical protein